jgi:hypothetical protein
VAHLVCDREGQVGRFRCPFDAGSFEEAPIPRTLIQFSPRLNGVFFGPNRANIFLFAEKIQCEIFDLKRAPRASAVGEKKSTPPPSILGAAIKWGRLSVRLLRRVSARHRVRSPIVEQPRDRELIRQLAFIYVQQGEKA